MEQHDKKYDLFLDLAEEIKKCNEDFKKRDKQINVISIASRGILKETAHSAILQKLLLHKDILDSFLKNIGDIGNHEFSPEDVRFPEIDRMDISIFGKNGCIIIENKVNGASEQKSQIYRYVQIARQTYTLDQIKIIYLNQKGYCPPSDYSVTNEGKRIDDTIYNSMIIKDFSHDIYNWINELYLNFNPDEKNILSALHQYKEYLEERFIITDKYKEMEQNIRDLIDKKIFESNNNEIKLSKSNRLSALENIAKDLNQLSENLYNYINDLKIELLKERITNDLDKHGIKLIDMKDENYNEANYGFMISLNGKLGFVTYSEFMYIGFAFNSSELTHDEKTYLQSLFEEIGMTNKREEAKYPCWNYINPRDFDTLHDNFLELSKLVIKKAEESQNNDMTIEIIK